MNKKSTKDDRSPSRGRGRPKTGDKVRRHIYISAELAAVLSDRLEEGEASAFFENAARLACGHRGWKVAPSKPS